MLGQKWELYGAGRTTVCQDSGTFKTLGESVGAESITLTTTNLPSHNHTFSLSANSTGGHTHDRGTMNITGTLGAAGWDSTRNQATGAFYTNSADVDTGHVSLGSSGGSYINKIHFDANRDSAWTGETSNNGSHSHTISGTINTTGSSVAHSNVQPSIVVLRWKRVE